MRIKGLIILSVFLLLGCSNTIKYIPKFEDVSREESNIKKEVIADTNQEPNNQEATSFGFEFNEINNYTLITDRYTINVRQFTPYSGVRELYEVPAGMGGLVLSIPLNLFDILLFGAIPNDFLEKLFYNSSAGINPFINMESENRSEYENVSKSLTNTDKKEMKKVTPLTGKKIYICVNELPAGEILTDEFGKFKVDMFDILSKTQLSEEPRKIIIYSPLSGEEGKSKTDCGVSSKSNVTKYFKREKAFSMFDANKRLYYLNSINTDKPAEPKRIAEAVISLNKLGFEEWSTRVEDNIRTLYKDDKDLLDTFSDEIRKTLYSAPAPNVRSEETVKSVPASGESMR